MPGKESNSSAEGGAAAHIRSKQKAVSLTARGKQRMCGRSPGECNTITLTRSETESSE